MGNIGEIDFDSIPDSQYDLIPDGDYTVIISASEVNGNKAGTGKYVKFTFQIADGEQKNRLLWHYSNFAHANPDVRNIGLRELKELGLACGLPSFDDTTKLHNIPIRIRIGKRKDKGSDEERNYLKRILWKETAAAKPNGVDLDNPPF